ncbi:MAG: ATP-binding protein [Oscillospiraceae bacterium]|nr:ATP-binding protein [Oscillospiraceae bacterium]
MSEQEKLHDYELQLVKLDLVAKAGKIALWDTEIVDEGRLNPDIPFTWSEEFRNMLGFTDESDFPNVFSSWSDRIHPDDKKQMFDMYAAHLDDRTGKTPYDTAVRAMCKNGEYRYYRAFGQALRDENGKPLQIAGALVDVHDAKFAMEEINYRDTLLHSVNEAAKVLLTTESDDSFDASFWKVMEIMGYSINTDGMELWKNEVFDGELCAILKHYCYSAKGEQAKAGTVTKFAYKDTPHWDRRLNNHEVLNGSIEDLSKADFEFLQPFNVKSVLLLPLFIHDKLWGFCCINDCFTRRVYTDEEINIMRSVTLMMVAAIDRRSLQVEIAEANALAKLMLDSSPLCCEVWDENLKVIDCNKAAIKHYCVASKTPIIEGIFDFFPVFQPDGQKSVDVVQEFIEKAFNEGGYKFNWMDKLQDGDLVPTEVTLVPVVHNNTRLVVAYSRDLREHNRMMSELNHKTYELEFQKNTLTTLIDSMPNFVFSKNLASKYTLINKGMLDFFSMSMDKTIGRGDRDGFGFTEQEASEMIRADKRIFSGDCAFLTEEQVVSYKGISYDFETTKAPLFQDGEIVGLVGVSRDVTERNKMSRELKTALRQAEASDRAKSEFLATMSHEIRTPLNAIIGISQIQLQDCMNADCSIAFDKIHNAGTGLLGIIDDILDLSKIESGKVELKPLDYDVASMINDAGQLNVVRIGTKPIEFMLDVQASLPSRLFGDELRLKQILNNILSNAIKYTDRGSVKLSVDSVVCDDEVELRFTVTDTGQGMKEEDVANLFTQYNRFNDEANRDIEGTGLGLTITKRLLELMDGKIDVVSEYGKGSTFTVTVVQKLPHKADGTRDYTPIGGKSAENLRKLEYGSHSSRARGAFRSIQRSYMPYGRVMIVDDIHTNLFVSEGLMRPYGLEIVQVMSGFEAIEIIAADTKEYDIIFMDHMMPDMDGIETTKRLRESGYGGIIVALTANALVGNYELFVQSGFDDFIPKPIDVKLLNTMLNRYVRDRHPEEAARAAQMNISLMNDFDPQKTNAKMMSVFCRDANRAITTIRESVRNDDIKLFTTMAHAMKSALTNIGENAKSKKAAALEVLGLEGKKELAFNNAEAFVQMLERLVQKLTAAAESDADADANADSEVTEDRAFLCEQLVQVKAACDAYDDSAAYVLLDRLLSGDCTWKARTAQRIEAIRDSIYLESDFEKASELTAAFLSE